MEAILGLIHPFLGEVVTLVSAGITFLIVAGVKKLYSIKYSENKKTILRTIGGILSFGSVLALSLATGVELPDGAIPTLVDLIVSTGLAFAGATGVHELKNG